MINVAGDLLVPLVSYVYPTNTQETKMLDKILRRPAVKSRTGLSTTALYELMKKGDFPKSIKLGGSNSRSVGWRERDIQQWIDQQAAKAGYDVEGAQ